MSEHVDLKHKVQRINSKTKFNDILNEAILNETEIQFLRMFYLERKDIGYIADILGYSKTGIIKLHKRTLKKIESLL